ncbi:MAG: DUF5050 domain-containing protein [Bacillota bacterium]|nr:DUF5050 domain-containing protein [Bacillota bacterium]
MKNNWKVLLFAGIILLALIISSVISALSSKVPRNDPSVTGNTAGNLNNGGLFAEENGRVYFSNAYDNGCLYSMNADETDLKKLSSSTVNSINTAGDYLYYYMDSSGGGTGLGYVVRTYGVYRSKTNGDHLTCLDRNASVTMQLCGDYIYYQRYNNTDFTQLYKVKNDKSENTLVYDGVINPSACHNGIIYFNGTEDDHYLYALDTATDTISTVYQGNLWYPVWHNGYIYYMDVSSDYRLCRLSLSDNTVEVLTSDKVDSFNVGESYIYYQRISASQPALMRMALDGSNPEIVAEGNYCNINLTSTYAYFTAFGADTPVYHTPVNGPVNVTTFQAAAEAVLQ